MPEARFQPLSEMPTRILSGMRGLCTDIDDTVTTDGRLTAEAYGALEVLHVLLPAIGVLGLVALFFTAVKLTTIVNATMIGALQPIVVSIVAHRVFGEHIAKRDIVLGMVALAGVAVVVMGSTGAPEWNLAGDLAAIGALAAWSAYFVTNRMAKDKVNPRQFTIGTAFYTGLINIPIALAFGQSLANPSSQSWMWLLVLTFGSGVMGHELMNWSLRKIPLWLGSTFTLLVPVVASAAAWMFLDEPLNGIQMAAMAVVLGALGLIFAGQSEVLNRRRPLRR